MDKFTKICIRKSEWKRNKLETCKCSVHLDHAEMPDECGEQHFIFQNFFLFHVLSMVVIGK